MSLSLSPTINYLRQTFCYRYLSRFVGISTDTIDIMVRNGLDSVHTLRAIDMDTDWHLMPKQISFGQKLLLRQALAKLADITDDDYNGLINSDDNIDDRVSDDYSNPYNEFDVDSVKSMDSELELKRLALQTQPVVVVSQLKMPINESNTSVADNIGHENWSEVETKNNDSFKCVECNRYFSSARNLEIHVNRRHLKCQPFRCYKCAKGFFANISLLNHLAQKHQIKSFACDKCHFKTCTKWLLFQHKLIHSNNRPFVCNYKNCNQSFKRKDTLSGHQSTVHSTNRRIVCNYDDCNKLFKNKLTLNRHQKVVHSTDRPFVCNYDDCDKSFKRKYSLTEHQKVIHSTDRPFVCNFENCIKSFKRKDAMTEHQKRVHKNYYNFFKISKKCL